MYGLADCLVCLGTDLQRASRDNNVVVTTSVVAGGWGNRPLLNVSIFGKFSSENIPRGAKNPSFLGIWVKIESLSTDNHFRRTLEVV